MAVYKPVVLAILDGWGLAPTGPGNAIALAKTPNMTRFWNTCTHTQLIAHGESVGLPKREPGNTETGHLNIGAGRIVYQDLPRINMAIADGSFFQNAALMTAAAQVKKYGSNLHLMGLLGGGGVHSDLTHLFAILRFCKQMSMTKVYLHLFTDGRDSPPTAAMQYIELIKKVIVIEKVGQFASVIGRYYAMDRDFRWDRTAKAYACLTAGVGKKFPDIETAIKASYDMGVTDEFIEPSIINPGVRISENDAVIFFNFRIDRPRQLTKAFVLDDFTARANKSSFDPYAVKYSKKHEVDESSKSAPFERGPKIPNLLFVTMTEYEEDLPVQIAFPPLEVEEPLGKVLADTKLRQLRMSESEKERFVTYYFNGQVEDPFSNEDRLIIPSPHVATYDLKPEMSAVELTNQLITEVHSGLYHVIVVNYANPDMVGHSGNLKATIKGCEVVDEQLGILAKEVEAAGGLLVVTADHGNAEEMINRSTGEVDTEHNANPVPFIIVGGEYSKNVQLPQGILADVAPTILSIFGIRPPNVMTGRNLLG